MNTRMAQEKDIDNIIELLNQVGFIHHNGRPDIFGIGRKYNADELIEIINNKNTPIIVATNENDEVVGYAFCVFKQHVNDNILTDIKTLYIHTFFYNKRIFNKYNDFR